MKKVGPRFGSDLISGLFLIAVGTFAIWEASGYQVGTFQRMGPGMFPLMIGVALVIVGGGIICSHAASPPASTTVSSLRFSFPVVGILVFAVLLFVWTYHAFGLVGAILVLTGVASAVQRPFRVMRTLFTGIFVATFCTVVFVKIFSIPLVIFRWPL